MTETREICRITVRWNIARTSENRVRRLHWTARSRLYKQARFVGRLAWQEAGSPTSAVPVRVSVISRRGARMDQQNIWGATKPLMDGVFVEALTPDDKERWVLLGSVSQEIGKQFKGCEEVVFVVEAAE